MAFQFRGRRWVLLGWCGSALFNATHFLLLGLNGAAFLAFLTGLRFFVAYFTTRKAVLLAFLGMAVAGFLLTFSTYLALLALAATLLGTFGAFQPTDRSVRLCMMGAASLWALHNALAGSPVATLMELAFLISNVVGWRRFHRTSR